MTVYVDNYRARYGRMIMCHMVADTDAELHAMAEKIGLPRHWFQRKASKPWLNHYDICMRKRELAIRCGAIEVTMSGLRRIIRRKSLLAA